MVAVNRRRGEYEPLPLVQTPESGKRRSSSFFGFGSSSLRIANDTGGWMSPATKMWSPQKSSSSPQFFLSSRAERGERSSWLLKAVYAAAAVSWIASRTLFRDYSSVIGTLESDAFITKAQMKHTLDDLQVIERYFIQEKKMLNNLKKTRSALDHEIRLITEVETETGSQIKPAPRSNNEQLIKGWLDHRKDSLLAKIYHLQRYLQASSKKTVLERFGAGPHKVKFTIDWMNEAGHRNLKTIVVETAPIDLMPASIHLFLDTVSAGIWDNTVFVHHEDVEHVVAAAPVDFETQKTKHNELSILGWVGVGFPEYTDQFPHTQYTLGFADQGPSFYINTVDNVEAHGPGGQGEPLLPNDADPCFAKVVEGFDVVDDLVRLGLNQHKTDGQVSHPWVDNVHSWTHIVSAKLIPND